MFFFFDGFSNTVVLEPRDRDKLAIYCFFCRIDGGVGLTSAC